MSTILKALKSGGLKRAAHTHAVLESPTGSGKTLALLCSVCAWFVWRRDRREHHEIELSDDSFDDASQDGDHQPKAEASNSVRILYTTRTHAQVAQAVREFRRSGYSDAVTSCILGSREHMCVEPRVLQHKESPAMVRAACQHMCNRMQCRYREGVSGRISRDARNEGEKSCCADIEELQSSGKNEVFCPYYYTREALLPTAEIIFCPYNYALDPNIAMQLDAGIAKSRNMHGDTQSEISSFLKNSVLIIDEAHNLPSTCLSVSSIDVSTKDIGMAFHEASKTLGWAKQSLKDLALNPEETPRMLADEPNTKESKNSKDEKDDKQTMEQNVKELEVLCKLLCNFEKQMQTYPVALHAATHTVSHNSKGESVYAFLSKLKIQPKTSSLLINMLQKTIDTIVDRSDGLRHDSVLSGASFAGLQRVLAFLQFIFPVKHSEGDGKGKADGEKRTLREEELKSAYAFVIQKTLIPSLKNTELTEDQRSYLYTMSLWCLDASLTMRRLHVITRNIIVTSGTLSPIASFVSELSIPFRNIFPSISKSRPMKSTTSQSIAKLSPYDNRVSVSVCARGCCDTEMNSSYTRRDTLEYKLSVGNSLVNFFRVIPDGVLVFFPSYSLMRNMLTAWGYLQTGQVSGVWDNMKKYKKLFIEQPSQGPHASGKAEVSALFENFRSAIQDKTESDYSPLGAAIFAVCRGRLSEGIDFPDELARGVVIIGIPYMNICDLNVHLRMKYLDEQVSTSRQAAQKVTPNTRSDHNASCYLTGDVWYQQESMRAVNQAMGRVIRHKRDYGAILLLDSRFQWKVSDLSGWIQPHTEVCKVFSECTLKLAEFFRYQKNPLLRIKSEVPACESSQKAKTASKRSTPSIESISSAMQYEKEEERKSAKLSQEASTRTVQHSNPPIKQEELYEKPLSIQINVPITPSASVNRSSSYPRTFFGKKAED
ncbi:helicase [Perkinsela sp. CCAP 1560/4]|nr:helicase [Perkinsela sp. CCAP 1560/4]|eukprot:KNH06306.1 helicase [Perkinsela sp. CCAP 1560/4]